MTMKMHLLLLAAMSFVITVPAYGKIDDASLKERLCHYFYADESIPWDEIDVIKERLGATDEQFHRALMEISREAEERMAVLEPKTAEWYKNRKMVAGVIGWLPKCKTVPVKDFLLNYAATKKNDPVVRVGAVFSYLRVADAEEAKGGLIRFLIEGDRMDSQARSTIIWSTLMVY